MICIFLHQQPRSDYVGFVWKAIHEVKIILGTILEPDFQWIVMVHMVSVDQATVTTGTSRFWETWRPSRHDTGTQGTGGNFVTHRTMLRHFKTSKTKSGIGRNFSVSLGITTWIEYHMEWRGLIAVYSYTSKVMLSRGFRLETVAKAP